MFELFDVMKVGLQFGRRSISINHVEIKRSGHAGSSSLRS